MKQYVTAGPVALASICTLSPLAFAQTDAARLEKVGMERPAPDLNRFRLSYRMGFNISANFENVRGFTLGNPGPATGGMVDRFYADGYNRIDSGGNPGNTTWFWGYNSGSQLRDTDPGMPGPEEVVMSSYTSAGGAASARDRRDDPQHGFELSYARILGREGRASWGLEAAFGMTSIGINDNRPGVADVTRVSDAFALDGISPPIPHQGTFGGPGPSIGSVPTRTETFVPGGAMITGQRRLEADLYGFRFGPCLEIRLTPRMTTALSAGLAVGAVDSEFTFQETVSVPNGASTPMSGAGSRSEWLTGGYVAANVSYALCRSVNVFTGVQFQSLGDTSQTVNGRKARLNLDSAVYWSVGLGYSF